MRPEAQSGFCLEEGLEPKVNFFAQKLSNLDPVLKKLMQFKRITEGAWGSEPLADFCHFAAKSSDFNANSIIFARF